jgi:acyl-homoserine lactone acylase PvdQ
MRVEGDLGNVPKPGDGSYDWIGYIAWEDMPYVANPSSIYYSDDDDDAGDINRS